jgi:TatD DNase family protein
MTDVHLTDTHCHIHEILGPAKGEYPVAARWHKADITDPDSVLRAAREVGVNRVVCVGCTVEDSALAVEFVQEREGAWASIGIHPHEADRYVRDQAALDRFAALALHPKVVAVGECGLDYYYTHSTPEAQTEILHFQMQLALKHNLPMVFHVRDAFADFWPIFDQYQGIRGVIHSFTATRADLDEVMKRGLYVGLNGIMTFSKDLEQLAAAKAVPLERMVLETDAPFLTPAPIRGTICQPKHVVMTAEFLAHLRGESLTELAKTTSVNATKLFGI